LIYPPFIPAAYPALLGRCGSGGLQSGSGIVKDAPLFGLGVFVFK